MPRDNHDKLSRRERQIMDILLELGRADAEDVRSRLPDPPSYSAARAMLAKLEDKGQVRHVERNQRFVYSPTVSRASARTSAISRLVRVFFGGSITRAVTGMVGMSSARLSAAELDEMSAAIETARRRQDGKSSGRTR